jgi:bifunctional DNA-binding transcriptional regulator/antitoxin component of YhaV-PrlF toxin-antitoxin module
MKALENNFVAYFSTIRLSEKGQLVLPKEYRDEQNLKAGNDLAALKIGNGLLLLPQMEKFNALCGSIERVLTKNNLTADDFLDTLDETREELFAEVYPKAAGEKKNNGE